MKTITQKIDLYEFEELTENSQNKAIEDYVNFIAETTDFDNISKNSNLYKAYKKCEELHTPWFVGQYIYDYCKKSITKTLKTMWFLESGVYYDTKN